MKNTTFESWFAELFGQSKSDVKVLLGDKTAVQFLIAWSLFESRCFSGFVKLREIQFFADRLTNIENFEVSSISEHANYFHKRYSDDVTRYKSLMHKQECKEFNEILKIPLDTLTPTETVFLSTFVVYRFRNNIFHGNKGVGSWLQFTDQITRCTLILQQFVLHAEAIECTFKPIKPI